jgi:small conductance mechanosensitive channel
MEVFKDFLNYLQNSEAITNWLTGFVIAVVIFLVGRWVSRRVTRVIKSILLGQEMEDTLVDFLAQVVYAAMMTAVIITALNQMGVPVTSVAAIVGAAGLAIGLALKDSLGNFAQGVMLVMFQPFKKGDFVEVAGISGSVIEVRIFSTVLKTGDNKQIIIPNGIVGSDTITNYSVNDTRRMDFVIGVSYDDDLKVARNVLAEVCSAHPLTLDEPATKVAVSNLGDSSVDIVVRPWIKTSDYWTAHGELLESFKTELEAAGCNLPYPQQDVHLHKAS